MSYKNTLIPRMFSKKKEKMNKIQNEFLRTIGNIKYKYTLFKAKDDGCYHRNCVEEFSCIERTNVIMFHVLNDEFGMFLYKVLKNKEFDYESVPNELKGMKFIAVNKLEKVVFVSFDITEKNQYLLSVHDENPKRIVNNVYKIFNWFEENIIFEEKRLNINYEIFFKTIFNDYSSFFVSLFKAFYIDDKVYQLEKTRLDRILDILFTRFSEKLSPSLECLRENIKTKANTFYQFINQGIYMRELDTDSYISCLPLYLRGNVLNFVMCDNYYDDLKHVFKNDGETIKNDENFVFNNSLFEEELKLKQENSKLIVYETKDDKNFGYIPTFIRAKEASDIDEFNQTISLLIEENLICNTSLICSRDKKAYYVCDYNDTDSKTKLSEYIKSIGNDQNALCDLLLMVNKIFSGKAVIKQRVFIKEAETYLDNLYYDKNLDEIKIANVADISFANENGYKSFYYPLCMMQIVESFLACNNMTVEDLYKCIFVKLFSQSFVSSVTDYLNMKVYKDKGMIGKLKATLTNEEKQKIEFLENIDLTDKNLLQRISLVPNAKELFPSIYDAVNSAKKCITNDKSSTHIALDEYMGVVTNQKDLVLSKKLIDRLTTSPNSKNFLIPEKVIISKDIYDERNYVVIGVIWNKSKLYRLFDLIATKEIITKNIYSTIILNIMKIYEKENIVVDKLKNGITSLLVDDNQNIVIDCNSYDSIKSVVRGDKAFKTYYTNIMRLIVNAYGDKLDKFTYFTYEQLFYNREECTIDASFNKIKFCNEHDRLYLVGEMCEECQSVYAVVDGNTSLEFLMGLYGGKYEYFKLSENTTLENYVYWTKDGILWRSANNITKIAAERVKIGIKNGVYDKFIALVPQKVVIRNYDNKNVYGILLSNYDFSNMLEINSFNYIQRLKVVLMLYKKILPHIENGSFVALNESIFSTIFMDKNYKGEFILPNLPLLNTEIIVNGTEKEKQEGKEKTIKLFSEFVFSYLFSDEALRVEMRKNDNLLSKVLQSIKNYDFKEEYIRDYLATKNAYCNIHGVHFASSDGICPECIADGIDKNNAIILDKSYFDNLKSKSSNFEGGEANLYFNDEETIDKIFNEEVDISFKSKVLGKALQKEKQFEKFNREHTDIKFASIYKLLYSFENGVLNLEGYRQEYIADSFKISSFKDKKFVEEKGYTKKDIVEILMKVCQGIEFLHSIGGFIGDLNGGNILIKDKAVYFIDKDGMSFDDVRNCVYTNLYIYPPSAESKNITKADDWYSLAIQAFYYLTYSHPFRGVCDNATVPKNELERMKYGFSVLGNHGINLPRMSVGWGLMPSQLIQFFLDTFEGKKRENMFDTLQLYLKNMNKSEMDFKEIVRQNQVAYSINENMYVDVDGNIYFKEEFKVKITGNMNYDEQIQIFNNNVVIMTEKQIAVIDDTTGDFYMFDKSYESLETVNDNRIYYTVEGDANVYVDEVDLKLKKLTTHILKRKTENSVWVMDSYKNEKFVFVENNNIDNTYDIYCNMIKVCSISQYDISEEATATILYDEVTSKWLVLFTCLDVLKGIVIEQQGTFSHFSINMDAEIQSGYDFHKNTLYFTSDKKIHMYSIAKNKVKTVYCGMVTSTAMIERKENRVIITNEKNTYMYVKS